MVCSKKARLIGFFLLLLIFMPLVNANAIDSLLLPFKGMDLSGTYDSYSGFIDLIIYAILFIGLAQATLGKRFQSRGGKAVVSAVGIVLAIGLAISEQTLGFNLRSFGPMAAGIFIFFVGFTLYLGIKTAGMGTVNAGSIALVVTYFSINAVAPNFFNWMVNNPNTAWIHALLLIAVLIAAYKIIRMLLPGQNKDIGKETKQLLYRTASQPKDILENLAKERNEKKFIKTRLEKLTIKDNKTSQEIINDLIELKKLIEEFGGNEKGRDILAKQLEKLLPKEHQVMSDFQTLKQMVNKLSAFDHQHFTNLKNKYHKLSGKIQERIKAETLDDWKKIKAEETIIKIDNGVEEYIKNIQHAIKTVEAALNSNRKNDALKWIDEAINFEKKILKVIQTIKKLEQELEDYTKREIKLIKHEKNDQQISMFKGKLE